MVISQTGRPRRSGTGSDSEGAAGAESSPPRNPGDRGGREGLSSPRIDWDGGGGAEGAVLAGAGIDSAGGAYAGWGG